MKIYNLDVDTSKPIRKVMQMQQNSTGALSVSISNDGKYIRNLSCALYDGDNEISAYATGDNSAGYKIDVGDATKLVKFTAKSVPTECSAQTYVGGSGNIKQYFCEKIQLPAGTYNQDEFQNIVDVVGLHGFQIGLWPNSTSVSAVNFSRIVLTRDNPHQQLWFRNADDTAWVNPDEPIVATADAIIGLN